MLVCDQSVSKAVYKRQQKAQKKKKGSSMEEENEEKKKDQAPSVSEPSQKSSTQSPAETAPASHPLYSTRVLGDADERRTLFIRTPFLRISL